MSEEQEQTSEDVATEEDKPTVVSKSYHDSQMAEAIKRRDNALRRAREAEAALAATQEDVKSRAKPDDQKAFAEQELQKREAKINALNSKLQSVVLENQIKAKLTQYTDHVEDSWALLAGNFKVEDEDGDLRPVLASNPYGDVAEYLKNFFDTRPHLSKNNRKPGPGVTQQRNGYSSKDGTSISLEDLDKMPTSQRVAMQIKDPALAKAYADFKLGK